MTHDSSPLISLDRAEFGYETGEAIVRGVSAELLPGRLTALIGPNAAGKSTLLRMMLGQVSPWSGSVKLLGEEIGRMEPRRRASMVSYVPQRAGVGFAFTVGQVVEMGRYAQSAEPAAVERALETCDLAALRDRVFTRLSFGQQQRVLLARAMAQASGRGRVMLLDEPGSAMDLWHSHQMMESLARLAQSGLGVLVVLHDLNLAARYADEIWLMDAGRLTAQGHWAKVLTPEKLEPVYRVRLRLIADGDERPALIVEPRGRAGDKLFMSK